MTSFWQEQETSLFAQGFQNGSETHPAMYPVNTGRCFHRGKIAWVLNVTTHLHVVLRLRVFGAVPSVLHLQLYLSNFLYRVFIFFLAAFCTLVVLYRKQHLLGYPMISAMSRMLIEGVHCILHCE